MGRNNIFLPFQSQFQYNLAPYRHHTSVKTLTKSQEFLARNSIGKLICHKDDVYEDLGGDEATYVYAMQFSPFANHANLLAIANEEGRIMVQDTSKTGEDSLLVGFEAHNNAIFDVAWMPKASNITIASASGDQSVKVFQIESSEDVKLIRSFKGYTRSVKCLQFAPDDPNILATGSRENSILLWDSRESSDTKPCLAIRGAHTHGPGDSKSGKKSLKSSVTAIQFQDSNHLVSSSDTDGLIKVWDLRRSYDRYTGNPHAEHVLPYPGESNLKGYTSLVMNSSKTHLYASCKDHHIYLFNLATYEEKSVRSFRGYENGDNSKFFIRMSLSFDDQYLACGSSDQLAYLWSTCPYAPDEPIYKLTGHESQVTCAEWNKFDYTLATCADDMMHRIWRVQSDEQIEQQLIHGRAEVNEEVQYKKKEDFLVTDFRNKENEHFLTPNASKKRRIRSPFATLPPTQKKFAEFPNSMKSTISPRKMPVSPRKLLISPRKCLFSSPTANLPNWVKDGKSPHLPNNSSGNKKRCTPVDWLTSLRRQQKEQTPLKRTESVKRKRAKKSLDMSNIA